MLLTYYAIMEFKFVADKDVPTQDELLKQLLSTLEKKGNKDLVNSLKEYIQNRDDYIKKYNGKYVQIYNKGIKPLDITSIDINDLGFNSKYEGMLIKVGNEIEIKTHSLASWTYNPPTTTPTVVVTIGDDTHTNDATVVLDTGCVVTTFSDQVLTWIRTVAPNYVTIPAATNAVGGLVAVQQGPINITFAGRKYHQLVNYATLPYAGLLGMDIFNTGVLTLDTGRNATFTFHS